MELKVTDKKGAEIPNEFIGLFIEDINYAVDAGLYGIPDGDGKEQRCSSGDLLCATFCVYRIHPMESESNLV